MNNRLEFNQAVAEQCGIREAVVATYLWDRLRRDDEALYRRGKMWTRVSQRMIRTALPFLTEHTVRSAVRRLREADILRTDDDFNHDRFDHTYWYSFTEYGEELMEPGCYV